MGKTNEFQNIDIMLSILEHFKFETLPGMWHLKDKKTQPFIVHVQAEAA